LGHDLVGLIEVVDENPKRPRPGDEDFLKRLSDLDRNLGMAGDLDAGTGIDAWTEFAERRPATGAPRASRPLLDLFPPAEQERPIALDDRPSGADVDTAPPLRRLATLAAAFLLLMAAGASAAAYLFRDELAAILAAWQEIP
jgi:hypothetical protein